MNPRNKPILLVLSAFMFKPFNILSSTTFNLFIPLFMKLYGF